MNNFNKKDFIWCNMTNNWPENLEEIIEEFKDCFDSMERYELLFEYAKKNPNSLPMEEWDEENQVLGLPIKGTCRMYVR